MSSGGAGGAWVRVSGVSRHLLLGFAAELIGVTVIAYHWGELWLPAAVAVAIGLAVAGRWLVVLGSFALSYLLRGRESAPRSLGPGGLCRLVGEELWSVTKLFFVLHPLAPWLDRPDPPPASRHGMPVLLVHGFFSNGGFWWSVKRWLSDRGISNLYTVNLEPVFADLDHMSMQLNHRIEQICTASESDRVILVAHSMGGLVCRAYLRSVGARRVAGMITLGSPHHGTALAGLLPGHSVSQMRRGNAWLTTLEKEEKHTDLVPTRNLYSRHDNIVVPQDSAVLAWADNIPVDGVGHLSMAFTAGIKRQLGAQLADLSNGGVANRSGENQRSG